MTQGLKIIGNIAGIEEQAVMIDEFREYFKGSIVAAENRKDDPMMGMGPLEEEFIFKKKHTNKLSKGLFAIDKGIFKEEVPMPAINQNKDFFKERIRNAYIHKLKATSVSTPEDELMELISDLNDQILYASKQDEMNKVDEEVNRFFENYLVLEGIRMNGFEMDLNHSSYQNNKCDILFLNEMVIGKEQLSLPINNLVHYDLGIEYKERSIYSLFDGIVHQPTIYYRYNTPDRYLGWLESQGMEIRCR